MYPADFLIYFISAAVILLASLTLMIQISLKYNRARRVSELNRFVVVFLKVPVL